jgi:hypothetical protein
MCSDGARTRGQPSQLEAVLGGSNIGTNRVEPATAVNPQGPDSMRASCIVLPVAAGGPGMVRVMARRVYTRTTSLRRMCHLLASVQANGGCQPASGALDCYSWKHEEGSGTRHSTCRAAGPPKRAPQRATKYPNASSGVSPRSVTRWS